MEPFLCTICAANVSIIESSECGSAACTSAQQYCALCLGLLSDQQLLDRMAQEAARKFAKEGYDGANFVLALNLPNTALLREQIAEKLSSTPWAPFSMSPKELLSRQLMAKVAKATGLRPSLASDLICTVTVDNDEFLQSDFDWLLLNFPQQFLTGGGGTRKRKAPESAAPAVAGNGTMANELLTKVKIKAVNGQITRQVASSYKMVASTRPCIFTVAYEREPIFVGGRYCKYSRCLPQSPWTSGAEPDSLMCAPPASSVSEKVTSVLLKHFCADSSRFIASGREDIDVRMLGTGRPFAAQLLNVRKIGSLLPSNRSATFDVLTAQINADRDVSVNSLARVSAKEAQILNVGQEEKRKTYSALCCSKVALDDAMLERLCATVPLEIAQKTVIRVLRRRPLIDRRRNIYAMSAHRLDSFHFLLRLQTQAGTYVKEFVKSDFGRTRPSVAELMGLELGTVDILQLDVLGVDLEWPPPQKR